MGLSANGYTGGLSLELDPAVAAEEVLRLATAAARASTSPPTNLREAVSAELGGLRLARIGHLVPSVVALPCSEPPSPALQSALDARAILSVSTAQIDTMADPSTSGVVRIADAPVPLAESEDSQFVLFRDPHGLAEHVAILIGNPATLPDPVPVRIHSACLTGDLFGSLRCDCGEQLRGSMQVFRESGGGVLLYLAQEGRGIGLGNKLRAYSIQETGLDTVDADCALGFGADERDYAVAVDMLRQLGIQRVRLLTNNPHKLGALADGGIEVVDRQPLHGVLTRHNLPYVRAKMNRAGHFLKDMLTGPLTDG